VSLQRFNAGVTKLREETPFEIAQHPRKVPFLALQKTQKHTREREREREEEE
jgi:hypothetical protein